MLKGIAGLLLIFCTLDAVQSRSNAAEPVAYISNLQNRWIGQGPGEIGDIRTVAVYDPISIEFVTGKSGSVLRAVTLEFFVLARSAESWRSVEVRLRKTGTTEYIADLGAPTVNPAKTQWPKSSFPNAFTEFVDFRPAEGIQLPPSTSFEVVIQDKRGSPAESSLMFSKAQAYTSQDDWKRGVTTSAVPIERGYYLKFAVYATGAPDGEQELRLTATPAVAVGLPTKDGHKYQIQRSADLSQWEEAATNIQGTGIEQKLSFPVSKAGFFRAIEMPLDLTKTIRDIEEVFLDTASFSGENGTLNVWGARVSSADYTFDDYLNCSFTFDAPTKSFQLSSVKVNRNIGLLCSHFLMKDGTPPITLTNQGTVYTEESFVTIRAENQLVPIRLEAGHAFSLITSTTGEDYYHEIIDEDDTVLRSTLVNGGGNFYYAKFNVFESGLYSMRFRSVSGAPMFVTFRFRNLNRRPTRVLNHGDFISTSLQQYNGDYVKYSVNLKENEILRMEATDHPAVELSIYDARGRYLDGRRGTGGLMYRAETAGTYFLVLTQLDFSSHLYSSSVSITQD